MINKITKSGKIFSIVSYLLVLVLLYLTSIDNYLLFHLLAEMFSIIVGFSVFILAWNSRQRMNNNYLLFLGISYLFISFLDIFHTFAYKGMGVFSGADANLPTQFWISARYMQVMALMVSPVFFKRKLNPYTTLFVFMFVTLILMISIFSGHFPASYIEGHGLTEFKILSEYLIAFLFLLAIFFLFRIKDDFDSNVLRWLSASYGLMALAELVFTLYTGVDDVVNLSGHYLKIFSVYFMYIALVETGLEKPHRLLYRDLVQNEEKLRKALEEVQRLAITDSLTDLYNRRYFSDLAENEVQRAVRYGHELSLIFLDIDEFKWVNDTFGHAVGDVVIRHVAECCRSELRSVDIIARYGGDEFVIVLPECSLDMAYQIAERLRQTIASTPAVSPKGPVSVTASMGIASHQQDSPGLEMMLKNADASLYAAKTGGRNRVSISEG